MKRYVPREYKNVDGDIDLDRFEWEEVEWEEVQYELNKLRYLTSDSDEDTRGTIIIEDADNKIVRYEYYYAYDDTKAIEYPYLDEYLSEEDLNKIYFEPNGYTKKTVYTFDFSEKGMSSRTNKDLNNSIFGCVWKLYNMIKDYVYAISFFFGDSKGGCNAGIKENSWGYFLIMYDVPCDFIAMQKGTYIEKSTNVGKIDLPIGDVDSGKFERMFEEIYKLLALTPDLSNPSKGQIVIEDAANKIVKYIYYYDKDDYRYWTDDLGSQYFTKKKTYSFDLSQPTKDLLDNKKYPKIRNIVWRLYEMFKDYFYIIDFLNDDNTDDVAVINKNEKGYYLLLCARSFDDYMESNNGAKNKLGSLIDKLESVFINCDPCRCSMYADDSGCVHLDMLVKYFEGSFEFITVRKIDEKESVEVSSPNVIISNKKTMYSAIQNILKYLNTVDTSIGKFNFEFDDIDNYKWVVDSKNKGAYILYAYNGNDNMYKKRDVEKAQRNIRHEVDGILVKSWLGIKGV